VSFGLRSAYQRGTSARGMSMSGSRRLADALVIQLRQRVAAKVLHQR
jgi:hypothetical protein